MTSSMQDQRLRCASDAAVVLLLDLAQVPEHAEDLVPCEDVRDRMLEDPLVGAQLGSSDAGEFMVLVLESVGSWPSRRIFPQPMVRPGFGAENGV
jgi:hypothetical protein